MNGKRVGIGGNEEESELFYIPQALGETRDFVVIYVSHS